MYSGTFFDSLCTYICIYLCIHTYIHTDRQRQTDIHRYIDIGVARIFPAWIHSIVTSHTDDIFIVLINHHAPSPPNTNLSSHPRTGALTPYPQNFSVLALGWTYSLPFAKLSPKCFSSRPKGAPAPLWLRLCIQTDKQMPPKLLSRCFAGNSFGSIDMYVCTSVSNVCVWLCYYPRSSMITTSHTHTYFAGHTS